MWPLPWKHRVLTTGPPGEGQKLNAVLKVTFHWSWLQNIGCIPRVVQYILEPVLHPTVCTSPSPTPVLPLPTQDFCIIDLTVSLTVFFSPYMCQLLELFHHILCSKMEFYSGTFKLPGSWPPSSFYFEMKQAKPILDPVGALSLLLQPFQPSLEQFPRFSPLPGGFVVSWTALTITRLFALFWVSSVFPVVMEWSSTCFLNWPPASAASTLFPVC